MSEDYYSDDSATFGDRLAAAREAMGLSQSQLASAWKPSVAAP